MIYPHPGKYLHPILTKYLIFDDIENERPWAPLLSLPFLTSLELQTFHDSIRPMQAPKQQGMNNPRRTTLQDGGLVSGDRVYL